MKNVVKLYTAACVNLTFSQKFATMKLMRKFILLATFFAGTPLLFLFSLLFVLFLAHQSNPPQASFSNNRHTKAIAYAALPSSQNSVEGKVVQQEARVETIRQFLARYGSPLEPYAQLLVETADKYDLDFRLLPAIAMQESNLCTKNRPESFNCWGFGIYGKKYLHFDNYEQAIEVVTKTLATKYKKNNGLVTPEEIMTMYTPSSDGSWARSVSYFMNTME